MWSWYMEERNLALFEYLKDKNNVKYKLKDNKNIDYLSNIRVVVYNVCVSVCSSIFICFIFI